MGEFLRIYKSDITDRQFAAFWRRAQEAGRARAIGFDGPPLSGQDFCRWMRRDDVHPWLVLFRGEVMGLYYLTNLQGRAAHVHFLTLPCGTRRTAGRLPLAVGAGLFGLGSALWERLPCAEDAAPLVPSAEHGHKGGSGSLVPHAAHGHKREGEELAPRESERRKLGAASGSGALPSSDTGASAGEDAAPPENSGPFLLDALIGVTPVSRGEAVRFVRRLGGEPCGTVPALCWMHDSGVNVAGLMTVFSRTTVSAWTAKL
ncbi:hypothetical protein [Mailhella sp.]|uniref:hypothetical protein n=1 Tax=Mailhella sp. TaxID=1981029 RepID=UPI0040631E6B